ncbi:hypothetical protein FG385_30445 [Amycolatopsis alkalitolerans]|uniref:Uncharacterized protein n=1 Tax=Amycolatopsis alkalitolerans TaxID=2547244 RepID=A0A5C4LS97_9PSEU|nr:hypothetical protein FG385_30445 [Amycolatopsis alkalitolerans]
MVTAVVAALVTVGALAGVASLRDRGEAPRLEAAAPAISQQGSSAECGNGPCRTLTTQSVDGARVELLADAAGGNGRFQSGGQVIQTSITELGARLDTNSLSCVAASVSACLVTAPLNGGRLGELLVDRGGDWRSMDKPYFSTAGVVVLGDVLGTDAPEVTVVESSPVLARMYGLDGAVLGCTRTYTYLSQLRGWPDVRLSASDVRRCS